MSLSVSHRITGQPTNTGSQQVSTRYSSTDGTATAAGTPKAASPPISAASTAPTLMLSLLLGRREGGFVLAPHARLDDGWFDYVHSGALSRWEVLCLLPRQ